MAEPVLEKDDYVGLLVKGLLRNHVITHQLVKAGDKYTFAQLFNITKQDLADYFSRNGFPPLKDKDGARPPFIGDYETVWTVDNGEYIALWLEKGTQSTVFSTRSREEFQQWWNMNLLEEYEFQLTYPWKA